MKSFRCSAAFREEFAKDRQHGLSYTQDKCRHTEEVKDAIFLVSFSVVRESEGRGIASLPASPFNKWQINNAVLPSPLMHFRSSLSTEVTPSPRDFRGLSGGETSQLGKMRRDVAESLGWRSCSNNK